MTQPMPVLWTSLPLHLHLPAPSRPCPFCCVKSLCCIKAKMWNEDAATPPNPPPPLPFGGPFVPLHVSILFAHCLSSMCGPWHCKRKWLQVLTSQLLHLHEVQHTSKRRCMCRWAWMLDPWLLGCHPEDMTALLGSQGAGRARQTKVLRMHSSGVRGPFASPWLELLYLATRPSWTAYGSSHSRSSSTHSSSTQSSRSSTQSTSPRRRSRFRLRAGPHALSDRRAKHLAPSLADPQKLDQPNPVMICKSKHSQLERQLHAVL